MLEYSKKEVCLGSTVLGEIITDILPSKKWFKHSSEHIGVLKRFLSKLDTKSTRLWLPGS